MPGRVFLLCLVVMAVSGGGSAAVAAPWSAPVAVSPPSSNAWRPSAAMNDRGDAIVAWHRRIDEYNSTVEATVRSAGASFAPAVELSEPIDSPNPAVDYGQNLDPDAAIDAEGRGYVVWESGRGIAAMVIDPGATSGPRTILSGGYVNAGRPRIAVDAVGNATAFWVENDRVMVATRPAGGSFGPPVTVPNPAGSVQRYQVAAGGDGEAVAVWLDYSGMYAAARGRPGPFSTARLHASSGLTGMGGARVDMNERGDAVVAWAEQDATPQGWIRAAHRPAGGSFGALETVGKVFYTGTYEASVAVGPRGEALLGWLGRSEEPWLDAWMTARMRLPDGSWAPPEVLAASSSGEEAPQLAMDDLGTTYAAWRRYDDPASYAAHAYAVERPIGGAFSAPATLSAGGSNVWPPSLAVAGRGRALIAYSRGPSVEQFRVEVVETPASASGEAPAATTPGRSSDPAPVHAARKTCSKATASDIAQRVRAALRRLGSRGLLRGRAISVRLPPSGRATISVELASPRRGGHRVVVARWSGHLNGQRVRFRPRRRALSPRRRPGLVVRVTACGATARRDLARGARR